MMDIHGIDVEGILCEASMCGGPIKDKNADAGRMSVLED